jgi:cytochrome oxidase Cu insertion factor (SCO1/SenC/PrrC family)
VTLDAAAAQPVPPSRSPVSGSGPATAAGSGPALGDAADPTPPPLVDRQAAFAHGAPKLPRRAVFWAVAAILVLGVGGTIVDRVITSAVTNAVPATETGSATGTVPAVPGGHAPPARAAQLDAPMSAFLGLTSLKGREAPRFSLTDVATGAPVSLASLRGHVVVLTFANAACNDICPVLGAELAEASALLGATADPVTFVTINSDPLDVGRGGDPAILTRTGLAQLPHWRFLTGSLSRLNAVWISYGITITADKSTGVASHNDLMYFIAPNGSLAWSAVPFGDESPAGVFSLPAAEIARFAQGIARYADKLAATP